MQEIGRSIQRIDDPAPGGILAFDLFAGLWIARDADAKGFSRLLQAPILLATFFAGPLGLFLWLAIRERRARAGGRWQ